MGSVSAREWPRGPQPGLFVSEIITILLVLHSSRYKYLKSFYQGVMGDVLRQYFPGMPCYERFVTIQKSVFIPLLCLLLSRLGQENFRKAFEQLWQRLYGNSSAGQ